MHNSGEQLQQFASPALSATGFPAPGAEAIDRIDALFSLQIQEYRLRIAQLKVAGCKDSSATSGPDYVVPSRRAA